MKVLKRFTCLLIALSLIVFNCVFNLFNSNNLYAQSQAIKELNFSCERFNNIEIGGTVKVIRKEIVNNNPKEYNVSLGRICLLCAKLENNTWENYSAEKFTKGQYRYYFDIYCESINYHIDENTIIKVNGKICKIFHPTETNKINIVDNVNSYAYYGLEPMFASEKIKEPKAIEGLVYNKEVQTGVEAAEGYILKDNTATDAGEYTATATLKEGYVWDDDTHEEKTISWSIAKAAGSKEEGYQVPANIEATQGQKLSEILLPKQWTWTNENEELNEVGEKTFKAKYTPKDANNYKEELADIKVTVNKKPDVKVDSPKAIEGLVYNKEVQTGVEAAEEYTLTNNTATDAGEYTATATLKEGYVWADNTHEEKTISWSIAKAAGSKEEGYQVPANIEATQGQKLSEILLPKQWTWANENEELNEVGEKTFQAKYTPKDANNYKEELVDIKVTVNKKPDIQVVVPIAKTDLTYTGEELIGVEAAEEYTLTNNTATNVGEYTATATLKEGYVWDDDTHEDKTISWSIAKAAGSTEEGYQVPANLEVTEGQKLSDVKLTANWSWVNENEELNELGEKTFKAKYTPKDINNYKEELVDIKVTVNKKPDVKVNEDKNNNKSNYDYDYYDYLRKKAREQRAREREERLAKQKQLENEKAEERKAIETKKEQEFKEKRIILSVGSKVVDVFGTILTNDVAPIIRNNRTMLPARLVCENLGASIDWNPGEKTVTIIGKNISSGNLVTIVLKINSKYVYVNGSKKELDSPVFIQNNRTYTPIRLISELLGANVKWSAIDQEIIISK